MFDKKVDTAKVYGSPVWKHKNSIRWSDKGKKSWWAELPDEKKREFIAYKERTRSRIEKALRYDREYLPNGLVKIWHGKNYSIYKPHMLDESGKPTGVYGSKKRTN